MARASKPDFSPLETPYAMPHFLLPSTDGTQQNPERLKGRYSVLFIYPKDDTSGCTQESQEFNTLYDSFAKLDANLIGLSKDSLKSHDKFRAKYDLRMHLISDEQTDLISKLGAWVEISLYGRKYMSADRSTFIIDPDGQIICEWRKVKVPGHAAMVFNALKELMTK